MWLTCCLSLRHWTLMWARAQNCSIHCWSPHLCWMWRKALVRSTYWMHLVLETACSTFMLKPLIDMDCPWLHQYRWAGTDKGKRKLLQGCVRILLNTVWREHERHFDLEWSRNKDQSLQILSSCVCHLQIKVKQSAHHYSVTVISINQPVYIVEKRIPEMEEWVISLKHCYGDKSKSVCEVLLCLSKENKCEHMSKKMNYFSHHYGIQTCRRQIDAQKCIIK